MINYIDFCGMDGVVLSGGGYEAVVIPRLGNIVRLCDTTRGIEVFRVAEKETDLRKSAVVYGMPVLFFPNRISGGKFTKNGVAYTLPKNEGSNHLHGFLYNRRWSISSCFFDSDTDRAGITLTFHADKNTDFYEYFPHEFDFVLTYELSDAGLCQKTTIINKGDTPMPMGLGYHTTFNTAGNYRLITGIYKKWSVKGMIPSGEFLEFGAVEKELITGGLNPNGKPLGEMLYTSKAFSYGGKMIKGVVLENTDKNAAVVYEWGKDFDFCVIWNDNGEKGFVCAEPQTWTVDAPNVPLTDEVTGYRDIAAGEKWESECRIYVRNCLISH